MSAIDERVVSMKFNNSQFLEGIKSTLAGLLGLDKALKLEGGQRGLQDIGKAAAGLNIGGTLGTQVEGVNGKFLALATIAVTALSRITTAAIDAGSQLVKSLTIDPVMSGLKEYETNLNSIQTILANTSSKGTTLEDVNGALDELNEYSDKTIYNFAEMARNIGSFTAAGVDLDTSTASIKGLANVAALSGSNATQAASAMTQMGQALASGTIRLQDWFSVETAGMGGQVFQDALKETARAHGVGVDEMIEKNGSFRLSLQENWLSTDIMTETLSKFTGDLTDEQLRSMGYAEDQIAGIQQMASMAVGAASDVKTASQLIGVLQETAQSGWAQSWRLILGDFNQAKALFTSVNSVIGGMISNSAEARNAMLQVWNDLGGRDVAIAAISNAFKALMAVFTPIKEAFRAIFPATTGEQLYAITVAIRDFTAGLMIGGETAENIKRTFSGVFAIFSIGAEFIRALVVALFGLTGGMGESAGEVLAFTAKVGDFITNLNSAIKQGDLFTVFFKKVGAVIEPALLILKTFGEYLISVFKGPFSSLAGDALANVQDRLGPLSALAEALGGTFKNLGPALTTAWNVAKPIITGVADFFTNLGGSIKAGLEGVSYNQFLDTLNTGLFAALTLAISKFTTGGLKIDIGGGALSSIKSAFGGLTDTLTVMQANLNADTLQKIAIAVGILTASIIALSLIDSGALAKSLAAITVMFTQLLLTMAVLEKITLNVGFSKMPFLAAALIGLGAAIVILAVAVRMLSGLSWTELAKGLTGIAVAMGLLVAAAVLLDKYSGSMLRASAGMIAIAVAVRILAEAVQEFAEMSWEEMGKGLAGVGATLLALGIFTRIMDAGKAGLAQSAGLILLAVALKILAGVIATFGAMSVEEIAKGLITMAGALLIIAGAMALMQGAILGAAALIVVAGALTILSSALLVMGGMGWEEIGKAMTVLAGSLLILAGGLTLMVAALPGAAALVIVAAALLLLAPALILLGGMSWDAIGKGLTALAGALVILAVAGVLLIPAIPGLIGLAAAISLIGLGVFLAATGLGTLAISIVALAGAMATGAAAITAFGGAVIAMIPAAAAALAVGIIRMIESFTLAQPAFLAAGIAMIKTVATAIIESTPIILQTLTTLILGLLRAIEVLIPRFIEVATKLVMALLDSITVLGPKVISTLTTLILALVSAIAKMVPQFVTKGMEMITGILNGIAKNIGQVVTAGTNIIIAFLNGIQQNFPRILQKGAEVIISFVNGLANAIRANESAMNAAGSNLASAIVSGMTSGIRGGLSAVTGAARNLASNALRAAKNVLGIKSPSKEFYKVGGFSTKGLADGLTKTSIVAEKAGAKVGLNTIEALKKSMKRIPDLATTDMELRPRISPVFDLTDAKKGKKKLNDLATMKKLAIIRPRFSTKTAAEVAAEQRRVQLQLAHVYDPKNDPELAHRGKVGSVVYNQYNNSPKALSRGEIYRATKNQLSRTRKGLPS